MTRRPVSSVGLVTFRGEPALEPDDRGLVIAFDRIGVRAEPVVWTEWAPDEVAGHFQAVVLRSCWDYFGQLVPFLDWLRGVEGAGVQLCNPRSAVLVGIDKVYLGILEQAGVPVPETRYVVVDSVESFHKEVLSLDGGQWVIKPAVSAWGDRTFRSGSQHLVSIVSEEMPWRVGETWLVQRFLPEILMTGEMSLVFFEGMYSHAAEKRVGPTDFRIHREYGGSWSPAWATAEVIRTASSAVEALGWSSLPYCRVDGIMDRGSFHVTEVEVIEPFLFFFGRMALQERFAMSCIRYLSRGWVGAGREWGLPRWERDQSVAVSRSAY